MRSNNTGVVFIVHVRVHCESSHGLSDECTLSSSWLPTLRPIQQTWALSPSVKTAAIRIDQCHLLLLGRIAVLHT